MRTFIRFHGQTSPAIPIIKQISDESTPIYFLALSQMRQDSAMQQLYSAIDQLTETKRVSLGGTLSTSVILVRRGVPSNGNSDSSAVAPIIYRLMTGEDACEIRGDDYLHVFFPTNDALSGIQTLPLLRLTHIDRPLTGHEQLMQELENITPICYVKREEPLINVADIQSHTAANWTNDQRREFGKNLHNTFSKFGFLRIKFTAEQMKLLRELHQAQAEFFSLPTETKLRFGPFSKRESAYQIPFGYSSKSECRKEFYVYRQKPTHASGGTQLEYPSEPANFASATEKVYRLLGDICTDVMTLLLQSYSIPPDKVQSTLKDCISPPLSMSDLACTSVIELFKYTTGDENSVSTSSNGRRPPLPCSIHSDASLLTLIPRCIGTPGLQIARADTLEWQAVESQSGEDEGIIFAGDMFARLTNDAIQPTQHRVVFGRDASQENDTPTPADANASSSVSNMAASSVSNVRYSFPFELFLSPSLTIDCQDLLKDSPDRMPIHSENAAVQSAQQALYALSSGRVSVNQTNL